MLIFIGPLPPPEGGFSIVTAQVYRRLCHIHPSIILVNRSARYSFAGLLYYFASWAAVFRSVKKGKTCIYLAASGGLGIIVDLLLILSFKIFNPRLYIHHHSFSYLYSKSLFFLIIYMLYPDCVDIALCDYMANLIVSKYRGKSVSGNNSSASFVVTVSNSAWSPKQKLKSFISPLNSVNPSTPARVRLGFMSRPIREKGFIFALDLHHKLLSTGYNSSLILAGSNKADYDAYLDSSSQESIESIDFLGLLAHSDISKVFLNVDLMLLPTFYLNEVEPMVILESLGYGIPVLTVNRACIHSMIPSSFPLVSSVNDFVEVFYEYITGTFFDRYHVYLLDRQRAFDHYLTMCEKYQTLGKSLIADIASSAS